MTSKPKNFSEAIEELSEMGTSAGQSMKQKLIAELQDLESKIEALKPKIDELKDKAKDEAGKAKGKVEEQVRENPWAALGIAGLMFFILGFFLAGKSRRND